MASVSPQGFRPLTGIIFSLSRWLSRCTASLYNGFPSPYGDYLLSEQNGAMPRLCRRPSSFRPLTGIIFSLSLFPGLAFTTLLRWFPSPYGDYLLSEQNLKFIRKFNIR